ncbi:MAG: hypothetical protein KF886_03140 [Candidatus Hydrogenedentes bacterium]|nr:hypothetical protein [Candidatus Hydrogenedentota bacterium]
MLQQQMQQMQEAHQEELRQLRQEVEVLRQRPAPPDPAIERDFADALEEESKSAPQPTLMDNIRTGGRISLSNYMDISANVDMVGRLHSNSLRRNREYLDVRHVELGLSGAVDPYGKFVMYLGMHPGHGHDHGHDHGPVSGSFPRFRSPTVNALAESIDNLFGWFWENRYWHPREHGHDDWELDVEEAYFTFDKLRYNLQLKVGKFKANLGKANQDHLHSLPWTDYPLALQYNFGPEGLAGIGASLSWMIPNPWDHYALLTYEAFKNDNPGVFAGSDATDLTHLVNLKNFWSIGDESTLELGLSAAWGPNDHRHGGNATWLQAVDLTYRWRPLDESLYRSFLWQTEAFFVQKDVPDNESMDTYGWFTGMEYQFARRWSAGLRYDFAQWPDDDRFREHNYQIYTTFRQSEFAYWRLGYRHRDPNFGSKYDDNEIFLQLNVSLGAHGAHKY